MQKHERLAIEAVEAATVGTGLTISRKFGRAKMHVTLEGKGVRAKKTISSSPGSEKTEIDRARQWAQRVVRELVSG